MLSNLFVLLFLFACVSLIFFGIKRDKQKVIISLGIGFISFLLLAVFSNESIKLKLDDIALETDINGLATLCGQTNKSAKLELDGQKLDLDKEGYFSYDIQLTDEECQTKTLRSKFGGHELTEKITISASSSFKKQLALAAEKAETEQLAKITAEKLALAEKEVETAIALAENNLTEEHYTTAKTLLTALETPPDDLTNRLGLLKNKLNALIELANQKESAEKELTQEHYDSAKNAIGIVPPGHQQDFTTRLATLKESIDTLQQAQATPLSETEETEIPVSEANNTMVLITPTGKKYHSYTCGSGNYTETTLEAAQSYGLTACSKCF